MQRKSSQMAQLPAKKSQQHIQLQDVSVNHSKIEKIVGQQERVLPQAVEDQLELNLQKYSNQIKEQIRYVLLDLLKYPSSAAAERHRSSNRLGSFDLKQIKNKQLSSVQYNTSYHSPQQCEDCGLLVQEMEIPLCASIWQFPKAGLATFHLFQNMKLLAGQVFLLGAIFSILAMYVSIVEPTQTFSLSTIPRKVSYTACMVYSSSNSFLNIFLGIQGILIILSTLIWWIIQFASQSLRQKYERIVDQEDLSASDFTVMLDDVPVYYTKERLQNEFNRYFESLVYHHNLKKTWGDDLRPFEIDRISQALPFGLSQSEVMDQQLQGLDNDIVQKRVLLAQWMLEFKENSRFTFQKADRKKEYDNFKRMLQRRKSKLQEMEDKARQQYRLPISKDIKTVFFVTFKHSQSVSIIEELNPQSFPAKIRYFLSCCRSAQYFSIRDEQSNQQLSITTSRAPDPQDIIWGNIKTPLKRRVLSRLLTWSVITAILGATFGVCYGFNYFSKQAGLTFMSIVMAVIVTLANLLMKFCIRMLSVYQQNETESDRQRGILIKCLIALPLNWIITPIIITLIVNLNIYDSNGLVYFIFFLAITNAIIPPFIRLVDPLHFFRKLRALWKNRPYKKMELRQSELNAYLQHEQYQIGCCYVYFIQLFYFTCLYAPMIPAIVISTLVGYFFMFWVQKYVLLQRSRRPAQNMRNLTQTAHTAMLLGPLLMGLGGFIWVCVFSLDFSSIKFIAYIVQIGIAVLYYITPYKALFKCLFNVPDEEIMIYEQCRSKIYAQYDRINPATADKGLADYYAFLQKKKEEDRITALNRSQDNLIESFDINLMIDGMTKIPNIFGKNTEITRKLDGESFVRSPPKRKNEDLIFVTPPQNINEMKDLEEQEIQNYPVRFDDKASRAETQKKGIVLNYNSSGNAYSRKKQHHDRRTISVLQGGNYDLVLETQSQKH